MYREDKNEDIQNPAQSLQTYNGRSEKGENGQRVGQRFRTIFGSIPIFGISTTKIKHCYGVIAVALSIVGNSTE